MSFDLRVSVAPRAVSAPEGPSMRTRKLVKPSQVRADITEADGYKRRRYRGRPRRGSLCGEATDDIECRIAHAELVAVRTMLARGQTMAPGPERKALHRLAVSKLELAGRAIDAVVIRRGGSLR
jgi:hypothetical protein